MTAQLVTVILDRVDGAENPYVKGTATWTPSQEFPDTADQQLVGMAPVTATFRAGGFPAVKVIANDTAGPQGSSTPGWTWNVTYSSDTPGSPQAASYYVLSTNGTTQRLSALAQVPAAQPGAQYLPLPSGTATAGYVPIATGSGESSAWGSPGSASLPLTTLGDTLYENATPTPARLAGNTTATRKFLRQQGTGSVSAPPAWDTLVSGDLPAATTSAQGAVVLDGTAADIQALAASAAAGGVGKAADAGHVHPNSGLVTSVAAGDASIVVGGTSATPTIETGTLDVIATDHPPAANWSNNSKKITSLANGSAAQDAAAFGQIPTALPPNGSASGDLSGSYPGPTVAKVQGVAITSAQATLVSDLNNATARSATATLLPGEETIFSGSTASQTLTLPASPPSSSVNTVTNTASVSVTLAPGAGATLSNFGTSGNITIPAGYAFAVVYIGTTWYVQSAGPSDFAVNGALAIANGGTGHTTQQSALDALAGAVTSAQYLRGNGTHVQMSAIQAADVPTLNQSTTGNAATATNLAGGATLPDYLAPAVVALTFVGGGTTLVNAALGNSFNLTLTASTTTLGNPSNPVDGQVIRFRITQGAGGSFTLAYGGNYDFGAAGSPTLSTAAAKVDILGFEYVASISKWCYLGSGLGY